MNRRSLLALIGLAPVASVAPANARHAMVQVPGAFGSSGIVLLDEAHFHPSESDELCRLLQAASDKADADYERRHSFTEGAGI